ncbi:hypothetical protein K501DRAFT_255874 [Backusella circina FSU 941]|nr:hypothetical protein K501DRAFT_255874 [Backusella circina FSU 941]
MVYKTPIIGPDMSSREKALDALEGQLHLDTAQLKRLSQLIQDEMKLGLAKEGKGNMAMLPSWITRRPTGQEKGEYLGLDLSGSYVRLYFVTLHGKGRITTTRQQKYTVKEELKVGPLLHLIEFMAECLDSFISFIQKEKVSLSLGLCISFPLVQTALNHASILRSTKDFVLTEYENKNVVDLFQAAVEKRGLSVIVKAASNGAASCLLAHSYRSLDTLLACTVSTGTNSAYWEKLDAIEKLPDLKPQDDNDEMILNTEWGSFGDTNADTIPHTFYDVRVNRQSVNPGVHVYEKMIAGLYLGEIVRLIMVDFVDRRLLFDIHYSDELNRPYSFESAYMSAIEQDESSDLETTKHLLEHVMNIQKTTITDRRMVKKICKLVGKRAARLIAAGMSAIIEKRNALVTGLSISVEGTIYEHYSNFPIRVNAALKEIYGQNMVERINIGVTHDGNGVGAALAAMIACYV